LLRLRLAMTSTGIALRLLRRCTPRNDNMGEACNDKRGNGDSEKKRGHLQRTAES